MPSCFPPPPLKRAWGVELAAVAHVQVLRLSILNSAIREKKVGGGERRVGTSDVLSCWQSNERFCFLVVLSLGTLPVSADFALGKKGVGPVRYVIFVEEFLYQTCSVIVEVEYFCVKLLVSLIARSLQTMSGQKRRF